MIALRYLFSYLFILKTSCSSGQKKVRVFHGENMSEHKAQRRTAAGSSPSEGRAGGCQASTKVTAVRLSSENKNKLCGLRDQLKNRSFINTWPILFISDSI